MGPNPKQTCEKKKKLSTPAVHKLIFIKRNIIHKGPEETDPRIDPRI